jgi:SAM-dependent methyltransferase
MASTGLPSSFIYTALLITCPDGNQVLFDGLRNYLWRLKQRNKLICYWLVRLTGRPSTFSFRGQSYRYFWHRYNSTWRNERAVEIPIAHSFLAGIPAEKVLEIGNVLSHYGPVSHEVVDKYERAGNVRNEDVCDIRSEKKYDLILSISTLEHVGWDEEPKDETKVLRAFKNLCGLLTPGGRLVVTIPLGYNPPLDRMIREGGISFADRVYLKREPRRNKWSEVTAEDARRPQYDWQTYTAHELLVGIMESR